MNKVLILFLISSSLWAQVRLDGIAAVVGDQLVLDSDIEQMKIYMQSQGADVENDCQFIDQLLLEKTITYQAKQDTILRQSITPDKIEAQVDQRISFFLERKKGDEMALLKEFGMQSMAELHTELTAITTDNAFLEGKRDKIIADVDVSPEELKEFYNKNKYDLPNVSEEIEVAHILLYPKLTEEHKQEYIDRLSKMKSDIEAGEVSFDEEAKIYSEDPGSRQNGGLYEDVPRGMMVKEFDAVAFNLEEGEISDPFETDFGFHIVKLEKRRGQLLDLRHILLKSEPNDSEIKTAEKKLDSIKGLIKDSTYTFKEAVYKFSDDKLTRYNAGVITNPKTGDNKIEKLSLSTNEFYAVAGLKPGDYSDVFEDEYTEGNQRKIAVRMLKVNDIIPAHQLSFEQDYDRIKKYAIQEQQQKKIQEFVKSKIPDTNIFISKDYRNCNFTYDWLQEDRD